MGLTYQSCKHKKIIKASARHLSFITLIGSMVCYITVFFLLAKPTFITCLISRIGFHIGVTFIYAPLVMKTQRVYRIFKSGSKGKRRPNLTGNRSLMGMTLVLISIEIFLLIVNVVFWVPRPQKIQRIESERKVELTCYNPPIAFSIPLGFNALLLFCCVCLSYVTRKLPENFNEAWYIFVSVSTTIFLWIVLLPTYFTMFYVYYKVIILGVCLITNGILTLLCLFLPKIYAVYFINEEQMVIGNYSRYNSTKISTVSKANASEA